MKLGGADRAPGRRGAPPGTGRWDGGWAAAGLELSWALQGWVQWGRQSTGPWVPEVVKGWGAPEERSPHLHVPGWDGPEDRPK